MGHVVGWITPPHSTRCILGQRLLQATIHDLCTYVACIYVCPVHHLLAVQYIYSIYNIYNMYDDGRLCNYIFRLLKGPNW